VTSTGRDYCFAPGEGRALIATFDGGTITPDVSALLLGETDLAIRLTDRFAACFTGVRAPELVERSVGTIVLQRVVGITLGYEGVNDHDDLRHTRKGRWRQISVDSCRLGRAGMVTHHTAREANPAAYQGWHQARRSRRLRHP